MSQNPDSSKSPEVPIEFDMNMFAIGAGMFMLAQIIGILVGFLNLKLPVFAETMEVSASVGSFLIAFLIATVILISLIKFVKGKWLFKIMLAAMMFIGTEMVLTTFIPQIFGITFAIALVILRFVHPTVFLQNAVMTLAIAGIGARIGLILPVDAVIIILIVLSIYDYIAVYKTKHMVKMFKNLISRNVPLSLIVPTKLEGMKAKVDDASPGKDKKGKRKFMMLGTGDIAFPVIFAVAAARHSLFSGIAVIFGAFFGIIAVYSILINSKKGAIPALPPIAACTIIAFILSIMVEFLAVLF
jgi:presenilin-like A22 family membrane protease